MISCSTCPYISSEDIDNIYDEYCDKLGCKISVCGSCEEEDNMLKKEQHFDHGRKKNKYERYLLGKNRLKRIVDTSFFHPLPAYRVDKSRKYTDNPDEAVYIRRCYRSNHAPGYSGYLKKISSKIIRRHKFELPSRGCGYKKWFDYWWELW